MTALTRSSCTLFDDLLDMDEPTDVLDRPGRPVVIWAWELREIVAGAVVTALAVCVAVVALLASAPADRPGPTVSPVAGRPHSMPGAGLPGIAVVLALRR